MRSITLKPTEIFFCETWYKSDDVERTRTVIPPTCLTKLCPFENFSREIVAAQ